MTLAAAHATLQALVAPPRARAGAGRPPRASRPRRDLPPSSILSRGASARRGSRTRARGMEDGGGATDIVIPDTFVPPSRELRGAEKPYFPPVGVADDPTLANPLQRQRMLSTEWFGCVFELEGALVKARDAEHRLSWTRLAKEREQSPPPEMVLKFASTMKPEDFVSRQLRWTRDPMEVRRLVTRRTEIYEEIIGEQTVEALENGLAAPPRDELLPGVLPFLKLMRQARVPMAATCGTKTFRAACDALAALEILEFFENEHDPTGEPNVVSSEDVSDWLPDPLPIERAAQLMNRTTKRCVVFGDNNTVTEAATECGAKSALLLGRQPRYELQGADAVFASLADVTVSNLKNLFADETSDAAEPQREVEIFPTSGNAQRAAVADYRDESSQTQSDDAGGKEPPSYKSRRRRRDV